MKGTAILLIASPSTLATLGCSDEVISLCDKDHPCPPGMACDPVTSSCVPQGKDSGLPDKQKKQPDGRPDQKPPDAKVEPDQAQDKDTGPDSAPDLLADTVSPPLDGPKKALGTKCAAAGQCQSGFCANSVCCDKACAGTCHSCTLAGKIGTCMPLSGSACGKTTCADGASASSATSFVCQNGTCAGSQTSCGAYRCNAAKTACLTTCAPGKGHCTANSYCPVKACVPKKKNGQSCKAAAECLSGACEGSVCCNTACAGECQSCVLSGKKGTCSFLPKGAACVTPSSCTNSATASEVKIRQCSGASATCQETRTTCTPYKCTSGAAPQCVTACTKNDQCLAGICDRVYKPGTCPKLSAVCHVDVSAASGGNGTKAKPWTEIVKCSVNLIYRAIAPGTYKDKIYVPSGGYTMVHIATSAPASVTKGGKPTVKLTMTDCMVTNTAGYGVSLTDSSAKLNNVVVTNNASIGIIMQSSTGKHKLTADQVTSSHNKGNGISVLGGFLDADRLITSGNTNYGVILMQDTGATISNVLSAHNGAVGLHFLNSVSGYDAKVTNATIAFNGGKEVFNPSASKNIIDMRNSIVWDTLGTVFYGGKCSYCDVSGNPYGVKNINKNPKFVDPSKAKMDFRLKAGSPCIDAGNPGATGVSAKDLDGNPRKKGVLDMGAYEKQ